MNHQRTGPIITRVRLQAARLTFGTCLLLPFSSSGAGAEEPPPINPALLYWSAEASQRVPFDAAQWEMLNKMLQGELPPDETKLGHPFLEPAVEDLLRQAAQSAAPCDWGLPKRGPGAPLAYLGKMDALALVAMNKAQLCFAQHRVAEGQDLLLIVHRLNRHVAAGKYLGAWLGATGDELAAFAVAGRYCSDWDEAARRDYAAKLRALPPFPSLAESYGFNDARVADWLEEMGQASEAERRKQLADSGFFDEFPVPTYSLDELVRWDKATWSREVEKFRARRRQTLAAVGKPWKEGHAELIALVDVTAKDKFALDKTSQMLMCTWVGRPCFVETVRTMLEAALEHGATITEADAINYRDAFEGEPLHLKKTADGKPTLVASKDYFETGHLIDMDLRPTTAP